MTDDPHKNDPPNHAGSKVPSGSGTDTGWSVEARYNYPTPKTICGMMLDDRWQTVYFNNNSPIGVPARRQYSALVLTGLYEYAAAQALRWWFLAQAEAEYSCLCVETRLVRHKVTYSYSAEPVEAVEPSTGHEPRQPKVAAVA